MRRSAIIGLLAACSFHGSGAGDQPPAGDAKPADSSSGHDDAPVPVDGTTVDSACPIRRDVTFANDGRGDLIDIPVLVTLTDVPGDGSDLRFESSTGDALPFEIDHWTTGGTSYVWVKVGKITGHTHDDKIVLRYGPGTPAGSNTPSDVWSNGYVAVWHFESGGGNHAYADSTGRTVNLATAPDPGHAPMEIDGKIGRAVAFDGNDRLEIASSNVLSLTTMSIESWVTIKDPTPSGWGAVFEHGRLGGDWYGIWRSNDTVGRFQWRWTNSGIAQTATGTMDFANAPAWVFAGGTEDKASNTAVAYQNAAVDKTVGNASDATAIDSASTIGAVNGGGEAWQGNIDELRISNVARSADWMSAQYASAMGTLATVGSPRPCL